MTRTEQLLKDNYEKRLDEIQTDVCNDENFKRMATKHEYENNLRDKCNTRHQKKATIAYNKKVSELNNIYTSELPKEITITVEWKRSAMWGSNPTAYANIDGARKQSSSISGCGYDKESTAVAEALNQDTGILKLLVGAYDKEQKLSYGVVNYRGYSMFEGGVGVDCFWKTFEILGYTTKKVSSTKLTDTWIVTKEVKE